MTKYINNQTEFFRGKTKDERIFYKLYGRFPSVTDFLQYDANRQNDFALSGIHKVKSKDYDDEEIHAQDL